MTSVANVVSDRVRDLRLDRGWSQRDLSVRLREVGGQWTRSNVGVLEADGTRAERLSDLVLLCAAFKVGIFDLLDGEGNVQLGTESRPLSWVREVLDQRSPDSADSSPSNHLLDPRRIGASDPEEESRLAGLIEMSREDFVARIARLFDGHKPLEVRDGLAQIDSKTPLRVAQAKRGHATRLMLRAVQTGRADLEQRRQVKTWLRHLKTTSEEIPDGDD